MSFIKKISAEYVFSKITSDRLPSVAIELLEAGYDSPSLRKLSGCLPADVECRDLFANALNELGVAMPSIAEAGLVLACAIGREVVQGTLEPYVGAKRIWDTIYTRVPALEELRPFVGLASEYEDDVKHRESYTREIMEQCRKLLSEKGSSEQ